MAFWLGVKLVSKVTRARGNTIIAPIISKKKMRRGSVAFVLTVSDFQLNDSGSDTQQQ